MYRDRPFTFCHFLDRHLLPDPASARTIIHHAPTRFGQAGRGGLRQACQIGQALRGGHRKVDRLGRAVGEPALLSPRTVSLRPTFTSSANIQTSPFALPTARLSRQSILAVDRERDLALVKIDADLPTLELGDSNKIDPGQAIFSLGNPLDTASVSRGVVAAIRSWRTGTEGQWCKSPSRSNPEAAGPHPRFGRQGHRNPRHQIGAPMGFGIPSNALQDLLTKQKSDSMKKWLTIGALDDLEWKSTMGESWPKSGSHNGQRIGFGGRMLCLRCPFTRFPMSSRWKSNWRMKAGRPDWFFTVTGKTLTMDSDQRLPPLDPIRRTERIFLDHPQNLGDGCLPAR